METLNINREQIRRLVPHAGDMCLLDTVEFWDAQSIHCTSRSHLSERHPLRYQGRLSIVHGIEYGAQAMAIHAGLLHPDFPTMDRSSYLVSVKSVEFKNTAELDCQPDSDLKVVAEQIYAEAGNQLYRFSIENDQDLLLDGEAMVITTGIVL